MLEAPAKLTLPGARPNEGLLAWQVRRYHRARRRPSFAGLLDSPEIARLIAELDETRWTGRPGYPLRVMVGMALAKSLYSIPTSTKTVALVREHAELREAIGGECPSVYAAY